MVSGISPLEHMISKKSDNSKGEGLFNLEK